MNVGGISLNKIFADRMWLFDNNMFDTNIKKYMGCANEDIWHKCYVVLLATNICL